MKRNQIRRLVLLLIGLGFGVTTAAEAGAEPKSSTQLGGPDVRLVARGGEQSLHDFLNRTVFGIAGTSIGTVEDFLVDRTSGRLTHLVVSVAEAPLHERRRVLPADTLRWQPGSESFEVDAAAESPADDSTRLLQGDTFLRASSLPGQSVRNGNRVLGRISDVVIDFRTRTAAPVVSPSPTVMKTQRTFVVSLSRMRLGAGDSRVATTTVTPAELARVEVAAAPIAINGSLPMSPITGASGIAQSSIMGQTGYSSSQTATAATTEATDAGVIDEPLTPTGRGPAEPHDPATLSRAAHSVHRMLQETKATVGAAVQVSTENGKLVLLGSVPSKTAKDELEQRAASAAPGVPLESRLTVRAEAR